MPMFGDDELEFEPKPPLWRRIAVPVGGVVIACLFAYFAVSLLQRHGPAPRPHQEPPKIVSIKLPPPPPPPPTPPPPQPQKIQEQAKAMPSPVKANIPKAPPKAPSPPQGVTTSITGAGNSGLQAGNGGGGDVIGSGTESGGGGGDVAAYWSQVVASQVKAALARDEKLRFARYRATVALVLDGSGHAVRATLQSFSGDSDLEPEINRVLLTVAANEKLPPELANQPVVVNISERSSRG